MEIIVFLIVGIVGLMLGGTLGYLAHTWIKAKQRTQAQEEAKLIREAAQEEARRIVLEAKEQAVTLRSEAEQEIRERRRELQRQEQRLAQKEEALERKLESVERRNQQLTQKEAALAQRDAQLARLEEERRLELERIAGLTTAEARDILLKQVEEEFRQDALERAKRMEETIFQEAEERARRILALSIQRLASEVSGEVTTTVVPIPSDEMKGRIIGREGRNIRALEAATGVDLIVDDTPEAVTISCFDPVRREVARIALQKLLADGRIHPSRIEEMVAKAQAEVEQSMYQAAQEAAQEVGVPLPPEILKVFGRLKFRYSYGQNVLQHSIEVAHLAGMLAAEIGADVQVAKAAGLLHDLGKAIDHEMEGGHSDIGADLVIRYMKNPAIARAVHDHHHEPEEMSIEGAIVAAADAISASRPGARKESLEQYLRRLEALEEIATSFAGVERAFAVQAGREVRIFVKPSEVDDLEARRLARQIAQKIESSLAYPGQIKVTLIREMRAIEYAK